MIHKAAEDDVAAAFLWYQTRDDAIAGRFLGEFRILGERIRTAPAEFPVVYRGVRRGVLRGFPYAVYFREAKDQVIVLAVMHARRSPRRWRERIR